MFALKNAFDWCIRTLKEWAPQVRNCLRRWKPLIDAATLGAVIAYAYYAAIQAGETRNAVQATKAQIKAAAEQFAAQERA